MKKPRTVSLPGSRGRKLIDLGCHKGDAYETTSFENPPYREMDQKFQAAMLRALEKEGKKL